MPVGNSKTAILQDQAIDMLLGYLDAACWPGGDGLTLEDALHSYPQAAAAGLVPSRDAVLRTHPEMREILPRLLGEPRQAGQM